MAGGPGRTERWQKFSKVLQKMTLSSKYTRALTFPDLFVVTKIFFSVTNVFFSGEAEGWIRPLNGRNSAKSRLL